MLCYCFPAKMTSNRNGVINWRQKLHFPRGRKKTNQNNIVQLNKMRMWSTAKSAVYWVRTQVHWVDRGFLHTSQTEWIFLFCFGATCEEMKPSGKWHQHGSKAALSSNRLLSECSKQSLRRVGERFCCRKWPLKIWFKNYGKCDVKSSDQCTFVALPQWGLGTEVGTREKCSRQLLVVFSLHPPKHLLLPPCVLFYSLAHNLWAQLASVWWQGTAGVRAVT